MDGHSAMGAPGYWLGDSRVGIDLAKSKIDEAITAGGGVMIRLHPYLLNRSNQISKAQMTASFAYLKGKVAANQIEVLPLRDWALDVSW